MEVEVPFVSIYQIKRYHIPKTAV